MEARLVDDDDNDVPEGKSGELWVRGPNVMKYVCGMGNPSTLILTGCCQGISRETRSHQERIDAGWLVQNRRRVYRRFAGRVQDR